jgi:protoheme IX farnesyltransferase
MKPRVMSLVIFTCVVGLLIAPIQVDFFTAMFSLIAVALGAGAAGTLNMWYESDIDALMQRTCLRPIPSGKISRDQALIFGVLTSFASVIMLYAFSNFLSALMLSITILFYVIIYTIWLKRRTSQNIVIGGAAGAFPPIIGWTIATNSITFEPIFLFLIIFFWTPSHFWALSLYKIEDYSNAKIPMLPVVSGVKSTKINIFVYSIILVIISIIPYFFGYFGLTYLISSIFLGSYYIYLCYDLLSHSGRDKIIAKKIFIYSILYLFLIFIIILIDNII